MFARHNWNDPGAVTPAQQRLWRIITAEGNVNVPLVTHTRQLCSLSLTGTILEH